jgi:TusA-related sulfurtransferase
MATVQVQEDTVLDARGLLCPMPIVKTAKLMKGLSPGTIVKLLTTDRGSLADVPAWAATTGNELLATSEAAGELTFYLRKG